MSENNRKKEKYFKKTKKFKTRKKDKKVNIKAEK